MCVIGDSRPAIVVTSQEQWDRDLERYDQNVRPKNYYLLDTLTVEVLCSDGEFSHDHPNILSLEKWSIGMMKMNGICSSL